MVVKCPRCKGRGGDPIYSDYPMGCQLCHACNGSGEINNEGLNYKVEVIDAGFAPAGETHE
jgi:DnaJ-class molecular chaperone